VVGLLIRTPVFAFTEAPFVRLVAAAQTRLGGSTPQAGMLSRLEASTLGPNLALALAVVLVLFWNFAINRIWTYSDVT
jgi:type IV secretory pathway VirB2 component (pilin)